jgi:prefoldin subunit 5
MTEINSKVEFLVEKIPALEKRINNLEELLDRFLREWEEIKNE